MPWNGLWTADSAKCANSSRRALKLGRIDSPWPILLIILGNGLWTADSAKCETTSRSAYMAESAVHGPFSLSLSLHGEVTLSNLFTEENFLQTRIG
jgi:hypothetical protein